MKNVNSEQSWTPQELEACSMRSSAATHHWDVRFTKQGMHHWQAALQCISLMKSVRGGVGSERACRPGREGGGE